MLLSVEIPLPTAQWNREVSQAQGVAQGLETLEPSDQRRGTSQAG